MNITVDLAAFETFALAMARITAFIVIAPPFSHRAIPGTVKAMLGSGLALAVYPRLEVIEATSDMAFLGSLILQAVIGAALGFLVLLVFSAVQAAGQTIDTFGGFQMAQGYDPLMLTSGAQFSRLYQLLAIVLLFVSDGYQLVIGGLARTFDSLPLGANLNFAALTDRLVHGTSDMILAALQIAAPLCVVLFLADVGLGLLSRVAPALNAFALGFPLKILMTISFISLALLALPRIVHALSQQSFTALLDVAR